MDDGVTVLCGLGEESDVGEATDQWDRAGRFDLVRGGCGPREGDNRVAVREQGAGDGLAEEARGASDEDFHDESELTFVVQGDGARLK